MFANLFFLILALLLISGTAERPNIGLQLDISSLISLSVAIYASFLTLIYLQSKLWFIPNAVYAKYNSRDHKSRYLFIINIELIILLSVLFFILGIQQLFFVPLLFPYNQSLISLFSLGLYFFTLAYANYTFDRQSYHQDTSLKKAIRSIQFLIPFSLPFLIFVFIGDTLSLLPIDHFLQKIGAAPDTILGNIILFLFLFGSIAMAMIFLPSMMVWVWNCKPLTNVKLVEKLDRLCERARFKHAGFRVWTVMEGMLTAGIIGVISKFRYVMFTKKLLETIPDESIEAILAHEIGHSKHRHLLLYPLILSGMLVSGTLGISLLYPPLNDTILNLETTYPSPFWEYLKPIALFLVFVIIIGIYFRYVFGYFSRLFERQADLYVFKLDIDPDHLIASLDDIAKALGHIHKAPNWHHYSIKDRIDFINEVKNNPKLIPRHHLKTKWSLIIYILCLALAFALLA